MLNIALIGCGSHAEHHHAPALAEYARAHPGQISLLAACDVRAERAREFGQRFGFQHTCDDWRDMIRRHQPHAVVAALPPALAVESGIELLRAGMPCVIEKPLGCSPADAQRLADAANAAGTPHMVSVNRRFSPCLAAAQRWLATLPPPRLIRAAMLRDRRREPDFLWATGIHLIDSACALAGTPAGWSIDLAAGPIEGRGAALHLRFADGCIGQLTFAPSAGVVEEVYEVIGECYTLRARHLGPQGPSAELRHRQGTEVRCESFTPPTDQPAYVREGTLAETEAFITSLLSGTRPTPTVTDVLPAMRVAFALGGVA